MLVQQEYLEASALTGDLKDNSRVSYRSVLTSRDRSILNVRLVMAVIAGLGLVSIMIAGTNPSIDGMVAIGLMISIEAIRVAQTLTLWTLLAAR